MNFIYMNYIWIFFYLWCGIKSIYESIWVWLPLDFTLPRCQLWSLEKIILDTIRLLGPIIYHTASLIVKIKLFVKKILVIWDYLRWMYWIINCITTVFETKNYITSIIHLEVYPKWYYLWTTIVPIILSVCSPRDLLRESLGYVLH